MDALWRLLMTHLAIEIYHDDLGEYPRQIPDIVPRYLPEVPADPFGDGPLAYRRIGERYVLYSLGEDRRDDGGKSVSRLEYHNDGGDLFLDAYLEEP